MRNGRGSGLRHVVGVGAVLAYLAPLSAGAQVIDTRGANNQVNGGPALWGQSFTAPVGAPRLTSLSFWVTSVEATTFPSLGPYAFTVQLYRFDGLRTVGPALFQSAPRTPACCDWQAWQYREDFAVGSLALSAGDLYVALLQRTDAGYMALGLAGVPDGTMFGAYASTYAGGEAVFAPWRQDVTEAYLFPLGFGPGQDLMFVAQFAQAPSSVVPEPSTTLLLGAGLTALAGAWRRRRKV